MSTAYSSRIRRLAGAGGAAVAILSQPGTAWAHPGHGHTTPVAAPSAGSLFEASGTVGLVALAVIGGGLLAARLVSGRHRRAVGGAALGAAAIGAMAWRGASRAGFAAGAIEVIHLTAAALWVGAMALRVVRSTPSRRRDGSSDLGVKAADRTAVAAAGVTIASGGLLAVEHVHVLDDLSTTTFGHALFVKLVLVMVTVLLGGAAHAAVVHRGLGARLLERAEFGAATAVVAIGAVLTTLPSPASALSRGTPFVRDIRVGRAAAEVLVTPNRPGANIVRVAGAASGSVTIDGKAVISEFAIVPAGTHMLRFSVGGRRASARFAVSGAMSDVTFANGEPIGTDCTDMRVGAVLAAEAGRHPVRSVTLAECAAREADLARASGHAIGSFLRRADARRVAVVTDGTTRATTFSDALASSLPGVEVSLVRSSSTLGPAPVDALVIATQDDDAASALRSSAAATAARGTYLAPWLLGPSLSGVAPAGAGNSGAAQVSIALPVDPNGAAAQQFLAANLRFQPGRTPTLAGLLGYLLPPKSARPVLRMQLFSPTRIAIFPASLAIGHDHNNALQWANGADLLPVSTSLAEPD